MKQNDSRTSSLALSNLNLISPLTTTLQLAVLCTVLILTVSIMPALAVDEEDDAEEAEKAEEEKEELTDDLEEIKEEIKEVESLIDLRKREEDSLKQRALQLQEQSKSVEKDIQTTAQQINNLLIEINGITTSILEKRESVANKKVLLVSIIRNKYDAARNSAQVNDIFPREGAHFTFDSSQSQLTQKLNDLTLQVVSQAESLEADKENLSTKHAEMDSLKTQLAKKNETLKVEKVNSEFAALEKAEDQKELGEKKSELEKKQLEIQDEIASLASSYSGSYSIGSLPKKSEAGFSRPVKTPYVVTQGYGKTSFSHHYGGGNHNGVDYSGRFSHDILAAADGKILATGNMGRYGYGNWVTIDHGNGLVSLYGHLSKIHVSRGDKVDRTDKIATMGSTGFSTATHLHFTLFVKSTFRVVNSSSVSGVQIPSGATVSPASYL